MKKLFVLLLALLWLVPAMAEGNYLDLGEEVVTDWQAFYARLDEQPELRRVDMFATTVTRKEIEQLTERYPQIEFGWTIRFEEHTVRTDATAFSTLHYSGSPQHITSTISLLRYCKNLRMLDFGHNQVDDLSFLYELPELRVLIIACNNVKDITPVGSLKHLEYLEMFSNWVEDISVLKDLPYLSHLNIGYNNIRDFSPLMEMPQLKRLWMLKAHSRMKAPALDKELIEQLQQALPNCQIDTINAPSLGGWRESVYYEALDQMYATGEYLPFPDSPAENR